MVGAWLCLMTSSRITLAQTAEPDHEPQVQLDRAAPAASGSQAPGPVAAGEANAGSADDATNLARAHTLFWQGHDQYEQGNYSAATALFEQSYAASPQPATMFNVALSMARAHRCADASRVFRSFSALEMPQAQLVAAAATFDGVHAECIAAAPADEQQLAPQVVPPPPVKAPTPIQAQPPPPSSRQGNILEPKPAEPTVEPTRSFWDRDRVLGWSFAASAVATAGAALYFNERRQDATDEATQIKTDSTQSGAPKDAATQMGKLKTERDIFLIATGIAAAASAGFAVAATKMLVFNGSSSGSPQVAVAVGPTARLSVSGEF